MKNLASNELLKKYFKNLFLKELNQKRIVSLEQLLTSVSDEFGLDSEAPVLRELVEWYRNIAELAFLHPVLNEGLGSSQSLQELILHSENHLHLCFGKTTEERVLELTNEDMQLALETLAARSGEDWSYARPFCSFPAVILGQKFRATLIHSSLTAKKSAKLFLRTQTEEQRDFTLPKETADYLVQMMKQKKNILISGATSSGKTTFLKSLIRDLDPLEHLLVIEDTAELTGLNSSVTHLVADERHSEKTMAHYCKYALRLRPERIILGEMRGEEAVSFLLCMNTGHKGMMTTLHANCARDALSRVATLFLLYHERESFSLENLMRMICQNIQVVIHLEKCQIREIIEVRGSEGDIPYFETVFKSAA